MQFQLILWSNIILKELDVDSFLLNVHHGVPEVLLSQALLTYIQINKNKAGEKLLKVFIKKEVLFISKYSTAEEHV
jgi:hypothetical protein